PAPLDAWVDVAIGVDRERRPSRTAVGADDGVVPLGNHLTVAQHLVLVREETRQELLGGPHGQRALVPVVPRRDDRIEGERGAELLPDFPYSPELVLVDVGDLALEVGLYTGFLEM